MHEQKSTKIIWSKVRISPIIKNIMRLSVIPRKEIQEGDWFVYNKLGVPTFRRLFCINGTWISFDGTGKARGWCDNGQSLEEFIHDARYTRGLKILDPMS